jgi:HPt (histidine-containing phosphotransfer) domain-containing protein
VHKSAQILDVGHLAAQTGADHALQREILTLFVRQSREILALLQDDTALPRVRADLAHKLKGSARTVGAFVLAEAAEAVETRVQAGDTMPREEFDDLGAAVEAASASISQHLMRLPEGD